MDYENIEWRHCVSGNFIKPSSDSAEILHYGSLSFFAGSRVYIAGKSWNFVSELITIIGQCNGTGWSIAQVPKNDIVNVHYSRVYKPAVPEIMSNPDYDNYWWKNTAEDKMDAEEFSEKWNNMTRGKKKIGDVIRKIKEGLSEYSNDKEKRKEYEGDGKIEVNDEVSFAHYYQPSSRLQFSYNIEWKAIKRKRNAVLLLSQQGLYCMPFDKNNKTSWVGSSLRAWLNKEFLKNSFYQNIEVLLLPTSAYHPLKPRTTFPYRVPEKTDLREKRSDEDYVFLLSEDDLRLLSPEDRVVDSHWIEDRGQIEHHHAVRWWLRTDSEKKCKYIDKNGVVGSCAPDTKYVFVRPAIWIDNLYLKSILMDVKTAWGKLVHNAKRNKFDYDYFKITASKTYYVMYFYRNSWNNGSKGVKLMFDLFRNIRKFSRIKLKVENRQHRLAKNAAESFYLQRTSWITVYKPMKFHKNCPMGTGTLKDVFVLEGLNGERIVVNTKDFDLEHPLDTEKLLQEGCFVF